MAVSTNCKSDLHKKFPARRITKVHLYRVPLRCRLVDTKEKQRTNDPYSALGVLINGIVNVFLANFIVYGPICIKDFVELNAYRENQEYLANQARFTRAGSLYMSDN
jgi:hypothetical protein